MSPNVGSKLRAMLWRQPWIVIAAVISTVMTTLFDATIPLLAGSAVDTATGSLGGGNAEVQRVVWILVATALARYVFQFGRRFFAGVLSNTFQHTLRVSVLDSLQRLDGPQQDKLRTGQIVSRSISDLNLAQAMVAMFPLLIGHVLKVVITIGILAWINVWLMFIAVACIPPLVWLSLRSRTTLFAATWSAQHSVANLATHIEQTVSGIRVVKAFAQESRELDRLDELSTQVYAEQMRSARLSARYRPLVQQLPTLALVIGIGLGGWLALDGHITIGSFLAFSTYLTSMTSVVSMLAGMVVQMQMGLSSFDRVMDVVDMTAEHPDPEHPLDLPAGPLSLELENVHFDGILNGTTLTVPAGDTVAIVGPPGSGKTMAVQLLCGFYRPESGQIRLGRVDTTQLRRHDLRSAVSCVFDDPFLYSASIRDNIAMGRNVTDVEIERAARIAQAHDFITALPHGYDEIVGERGLTLSGGQRQRIAIARAVLERPRVLILDDATSAIDATTEHAIYEQLSTELSDVTILAVAHRNSTLSLADSVALIDNGRIVDHGSLSHMRANPQFVYLMDVQEHLRKRNSHEPFVPFDDGTEPEWTQLWPEIASSQHDSRLTINSSAMKAAASVAGANPAAGGRGRGRGGMAASIPATPELLARVDALPPTRDTPGPRPLLDHDHGKVTAHQLFASVRWLIVVVIGLYIVGVAASLTIPTLVRAAIDRGVTAHNPLALWIVTGIGISVVIVAWLADIATTIVTARTGECLLYHLRLRSYAQLQRLGMDYFEKTMSGTIMTRMTTDIEALNSFLQTGLAQTVVSLTTLLGILALLGATSLQLFAIAVIGVPLIGVATVFFKRISSRLYTQAREQISGVNALFQEHIGGLRSAQMARMEDAALADFSTQAARYRATRIKTQTAVAVYFPGINAVSQILQAAVLGVGAHLVAHGELAAGVLVAFLLYLDRLYGPIQHLSQVFDSYQQAQVGFRRISDLLSTPSSVPNEGRLVPAQSEDEGTDITFHNVGFSYSHDSAAVIEDLTLTIQPGSTVAVVGPTGAGKSTIVKLIERFYDPTTGKVASKRHDIRDYDIHAWRRTVGFVPQETHLFTGTVAENIAYGLPDATAEEITDAARRVGALRAIAAIDGGFRATVGERGQGLSSGQRQLIALARAEMMKPEILLLDEATATLDPATEKTILSAAERLTQTRTSVIVAHRLATAAKADRILVIANGAVVEDGDHASLRTYGGIYATMWAHGEQEIPR
ncbi:ABC transporter ATP-binding protein [Corynebacterium diphtheriae]|nr:ABC transporter ATP-binding protein [Corynebacterium diphtheriae]